MPQWGTTKHEKGFKESSPAMGGIEPSNSGILEPYFRTKNMLLEL